MTIQEKAIEQLERVSNHLAAIGEKEDYTDVAIQALERETILDEAIKRYTDNAEYERTHGNLQGCLEFKQLVKWLKELRAFRKIYLVDYVNDYLRAESEDKE